MPSTGIVLRILPTVARQAEYGYLIVWETVHKMEAIDYLAMEMAATSVAFERLKHKQIMEARHRIRQDFFDDLLDGKIESVVPVKSLAEIHNMDSSRMHICIVTKVEQPVSKEQDPLVALRVFQQFKQNMVDVIGQVANRHSRSMVTIHRGSVLISFLQAEDEESGQILNETRDVLQEMHQELSKIQNSIQIGVGGVCRNFLQIRNSYLNALEAIELRQRTSAKVDVSFYEDLMVYHLLDSVDEPTLESFRAQAIGRVLAHDAKNNTKLIDTLEAYFTFSGNITRAAENSFQHRNTFIYRMKKIRELLNIDMKNPDELLKLQLGLKVNRILNRKPGGK